MPTPNRSAILALAFTLLCAGPALAETKWRRVESGRWELYTDTGEKSGIAVMRQLLEMQSVFGAMAKPLPDTAPPICVLLFKSARDFEPFRAGASNSGLFQSGAERDYILLMDKGEEALRSARHEYVHLALTHTTGPLPQWLEEGLAEYFSTLQRKADRAVVGKPVPGHLQVLASESWLDSLNLVAVREASKFYNDSRLAGLYYAESWALVHLLMRSPDQHVQFQRFIDNLRAGQSQLAAFESAFGRTMDAALAEARTAVAQNRFPEAEVPIGAVPQTTAIQVRAVQDAESAVVRAGALMAHSKTAEAEVLFRDAAKRWPQDPRPVAGLGYVAMSRSDYAKAKDQLERAIALNDPQASTYFQYAMLVRDTHGQEALVTDSLRKAVQMNPSFAEAWYLLGITLLRDGSPGEAIDCITRAVAILPRQSTFWESLGRAYQAAGRREDARSAAQRAIESATTPEQTSLANGLVRDIEANVRPLSATKPGTLTPKGWEPPKGDKTITGKLVLVDCTGTLLKFQIETAPAAGKKPAERTVLATDQPNRIMLRGGTAQNREFVCGPQKEAPLVEAGYREREMAEPAPPPPPAAPAKPAPAKPTARRRVPARPAPKAPAKPPEPPIAGELVTLEFK